MEESFKKNSWMRDPRYKHEYLDSDKVQTWAAQFRLLIFEPYYKTSTILLKLSGIDCPMDGSFSESFSKIELKLCIFC